MKKNYYVMDMEWSSSYLGTKNRKGVRLYNEIIQIGIVKIEDGQLTDRLLVNVWPSEHGFVSKKVEKLTTLSYQSLKKERNFLYAANLLCDFIGNFEDAVVFTWDTCDAKVLQENCDYWETAMDLDKLTYIDLQASIGKKCFPELRDRKSVLSVLNHLELVSEGQAHNALVDAQNEGKILLKAFESPEEACEYYEKDYWKFGTDTVVEPFLAVCGKMEVEATLRDKRTSLYMGREPEDILYSRFGYNRKHVMVWKDGDEIFAEEWQIEKGIPMLRCCVKKLDETGLRYVEERYQKYLNKKEKAKEAESLKLVQLAG